MRRIVPWDEVERRDEMWYDCVAGAFAAVRSVHIRPR
jgi:hypothetical protein